jgi:hypothetical protein
MQLNNPFGQNFKTAFSSISNSPSGQKLKLRRVTSLDTVVDSQTYGRRKIKRKR